MARNDGRTVNDLREIKFTRSWLDHAEGSVLVEFGKTRVLCVASFTPGVPRWLKDTGNGWVTSEYSMLPRATHTRSDRESVKGKLGGRTQEISRGNSRTPAPRRRRPSALPRQHLHCSHLPGST